MPLTSGLDGNTSLADSVAVFDLSSAIELYPLNNATIIGNGYAFRTGLIVPLGTTCNSIIRTAIHLAGINGELVQFF